VFVLGRVNADDDVTGFLASQLNREIVM
jgi:hypothetical protein